MIVVTGGAGFVGSNLIKGLNEKGITNILVVDNLKNGRKFVNLLDCAFIDFVDKDDFINLLDDGSFGDSISAIFHEGACSSTTEWDGTFLLKNNYEYSKILFHYAMDREIPFSYASSAATYGLNPESIPTPKYERPLNMYGYSKLLFDNYVRRYIQVAKNQVIGLRYFNVYGPGEQHKEGMASVAYHLNQQMQEHKSMKLFEGSHGYEPGEQRRDFVYIKDVVDVIIWFYEHRNLTGIYNLGTGKSEPFNAIAQAIQRWYGFGDINYIPFPEKLKNVYQSFTQADISELRKVGYTRTFSTVAEGVSDYMDRIGDKSIVAE